MVCNGIIEVANKVAELTKSYNDKVILKVSNKCLQQLINITEEEYGFIAGSIKPATIWSCI
jgi:hypothetical protein